MNGIFPDYIGPDTATARASLFPDWVGGDVVIPPSGGGGGPILGGGGGGGSAFFFTRDLFDTSRKIKEDRFEDISKKLSVATVREIIAQIPIDVLDIAALQARVDSELIDLPAGRRKVSLEISDDLVEELTKDSTNLRLLLLLAV